MSRSNVSSFVRSNSDSDDDAGFDVINQTYTRRFLETLSDQALRGAERAMCRHINALRSRSERTYTFEVELCYIQDEINRRNSISGPPKEV